MQGNLRGIFAELVGRVLRRELGTNISEIIQEVPSGKLPHWDLENVSIHFSAKSRKPIHD